MIYRYLIPWGLILMIGSFLLSGCGEESPDPILEVPAATSASAPSLPTAAQPVATQIAPAEETNFTTPASQGGDTNPAATSEGTATLVSTPTKANPIDLPFLMKIDRVSTVPGKGTLLEGRVTNGTLQSNGSVEIFGSQNQVLNASVLATLASSISRQQVTVGDYAGILVQGVDATQVTPGMLLAEAGGYDSYEEALQVLQ